MFTYIEKQKNKWYLWFRERADGPHVKVWLAVFAFTESIIFPIPTAVFLVLILMAGTKKWLHYVFFSAFFSVLGGIVGYFIGMFFFDAIGMHIINFYGLGQEMRHVQALFNDNAFFVNFIGAFTPVPYKIFTLSSGFLHVNFLEFFLASFVGRTLHFLLVGSVMRLFGRVITEVFLQYFNIIALIIIAALIFSFIM